jgi:hypothetical protein
MDDADPMIVKSTERQPDRLKGWILQKMSGPGSTRRIAHAGMFVVTSTVRGPTSGGGRFGRPPAHLVTWLFAHD